MILEILLHLVVIVSLLWVLSNAVSESGEESQYFMRSLTLVSERDASNT